MGSKLRSRQKILYRQLHTFTCPRFTVALTPESGKSISIRRPGDVSPPALRHSRKNVRVAAEAKPPHYVSQSFTGPDAAKSRYRPRVLPGHTRGARAQ